MEVVEEEQFTFSYGQCLYCFIGLVQIKTSVLREEATGSVWNIDKYSCLSSRHNDRIGWVRGGREGGRVG